MPVDRNRPGRKGSDHRDLVRDPASQPHPGRGRAARKDSASNPAPQPHPGRQRVAREFRNPAADRIVAGQLARPDRTSSVRARATQPHPNADRAGRSTDPARSTPTCPPDRVTGLVDRRMNSSQRSRTLIGLLLELRSNHCATHPLLIHPTSPAPRLRTTFALPTTIHAPRLPQRRLGWVRRRHPVRPRPGSRPRRVPAGSRRNGGSCAASARPPRSRRRRRPPSSPEARPAAASPPRTRRRLRACRSRSLPTRSRSRTGGTRHRDERPTVGRKEPAERKGRQSGGEGDYPAGGMQGDEDGVPHGRTPNIPLRNMFSINLPLWNVKVPSERARLIHPVVDRLPPPVEPVHLLLRILRHIAVRHPPPAHPHGGVQR